jgi:predicted ATP-grasp superfamily ATP-dependent carboligase
VGNGVEPETPALLLGSGITVLGTLRSLSMAGIPALCLSAEREMERHSRWYRPPPGAAFLAGPESLADHLSRLPLPRGVLFACSDHWVRAVGELDSGLAQRFPISQLSPELYRLFVDKGGFAGLLARFGVPHPRTVVLESRDDLEQVPPEELPGYFLKPRDSLGFARRWGIKALRVASREEAAARFEELKEAGFAVVLQELIPGPADRHYYVEGFIDREGRPRATFARRRLRMFPPDFGNSTYMVSIPLEEVAAAAADLHRLFAAVGYRGIFSAELKLDDRDGLFKLLEVNVRPWWYIELATHCGINVAALAYRDALGRDVPLLESYRTGVRSMHFEYDLHVCGELRRRGAMSLGDCLRDWRRARFTVFRWDDPLPALAGLAGKVRRRWAGRAAS